MKLNISVMSLFTASFIACDPAGGDRKGDDPQDSAVEGDADADGDADSDADGDGDSDSDSDADIVCRGFSSTATEWALPSISGDFTGWASFYSPFVATDREVGSKSLYYYSSTFDLTADGVSDLVITWDQVDADIGNKHWLVYKGGPSGFSTTPSKWTLPSITGDFPYVAPFYSTGVATDREVGGESLYYYSSTFDLTADGVSDLVITWDQVDPDIGSKHWLVYKGGASGFSATASKWTLPTISGDFPYVAPFYSTNVATDREVGSKSLYYYSFTFDLTADGVSDLVITWDQVDANIGKKYWLVYAGGASGFSTTAMKWSLPSISGDFSYVAPFYSTSVATDRDVGSESLYYYASTFDLSGDGVNDLVITWDQVDPDIGNKHWLVYEGGASGFSTTPIKWSLPSITGDFTDVAPFYSTNVATDREVGSKVLYYYSSTFDLTGDGVSDLVITWDQVDADIGNKHWLVYEGGTSGFSTTAMEWSLPSISGAFPYAAPFYSTSVATDRDVGSNSLYYYSSTMDLTGDGGNDLVLTLDQVDADIGNKHWLVYKGLCE